MIKYLKREKILKIFVFIIFSLIIFSCDKPEVTISDTQSVTIGSFNIAWLGDGIRDRIDRTEDDYKMIADVIAESGMDITGVQEIENKDALRRVVKYLKGYSFLCGKYGREQNVGLIYKNFLKVSLVGEYMPLAIDPGRNRPGLVVSVKKGNFDWLMMVVHFKSTSHYDNTPEKLQSSRETRQLQAQISAAWADSVINAGKEKDIIIVGDFNDTPQRKKFRTLDPLAYDDNLYFITKDIKSCKFKTMYLIDHIIISKSVLKRYINNSVKVFNIRSAVTDKEINRISDHCPVSPVFDNSLKYND